MSSEPTVVSTTLSYFVPPEDGSTPYVSINADSTTRRMNFGRADHTVQIENLRGREGSVSLDKNGFQFFRHPAKHTSFAND